VLVHSLNQPATIGVRHNHVSYNQRNVIVAKQRLQGMIAILTLNSTQIQRFNHFFYGQSR
jgi:F0F1-type ATP synthase beta subunit